ncbi:MAG: hypothetical protein JXB07_00790 [Anaerolineae bacterium]|nr:hypothetical protein [Anaerolineae bacterium]
MAILVLWQLDREKEISLHDVRSDTVFHVGVWSTRVRFENGPSWNSLGNISFEFVEPYASGDLDQDGDRDYAILIINDNGGSGKFLFLVSVLNHYGRPLQSSTVCVGDRVAVEEIAIEDAVIIVDIVDLRFGKEWRKRYRLIGQSLHPVSE